MTRNSARIIAKYLREGGWSEVTALRRELAASKARLQEMSGHDALSDETNELGRWRGPIEG
jgi:hypothetical protein